MAFASARSLLRRITACCVLLGVVPVVASARLDGGPRAEEEKAGLVSPGAKPAGLKGVGEKISSDDSALLKEKERARLAQLAKEAATKEAATKEAATKEAVTKEPTKLTASARVPIGQMSKDAQIAVRGSLIVTATDGPNVGGVRLLRARSSSLEVLFFAPSPQGFVAAGVALVEDSIFYVLNSKDDKSSIVVALGLDGGYRWSRELAGPARSLPLVQTSDRGEAQTIWILAASGKQLQLASLDATTGLAETPLEVSACSADSASRLYHLRQDGPASLAIWCRDGADGGAASKLIYIPRPQSSQLQALTTPFADAPTVALAEPGIESAPTNTTPVQREWLFAGWTGASKGVSLGCEFRTRKEPCRRLAAHAWGGDEPPGSLAFSLHDDVTDAWSRLTLLESGRMAYRGAGPTLQNFQLDFEDVTSASLGNFDADDEWELVVASGGELGVFDTPFDSRVIERFPRGDLALSGVTPTWLQNTTDDAEQPGIDEETLTRSAARNGAGGGFLLEALTLSPSPEPRLGASNRTLLGLGKLESVVFQPARDALHSAAPGPVSEHVLASAAGGRWYFHEVDAVKVTERQRDGTLLMLRVWPPEGQSTEITSFDAASDSIAIATRTEALWCDVPEGTSPLKCEVVAADSSPGPVALSPDGRTYWLGTSEGSVRRWYRAGPSSVRSELRGIAAAQGELQLLRAFDSALYVGREATVDSYSVGSVPEKQKSFRFHADAIERCDAERAYALNDGQLVYASGNSDFEVVQDQPAFIRAIACGSHGDLIGVSSRFGAFRLPSPPGWPWPTLLICLGVVALPALGLLFFGPLREQQRRLSRAHNGGEKVGAVDNVVSHILDADSPKERLESGTRGQQALVGALRDFLDNEATLPPLTLGVYGAWGSGKSSVMRMLDGQLRKTGRYVTVWFNAWRHHQESQLGPALLQNIVREFRRQAGPRMRFYSLLSALRDSRRTFYWGAAALTLALPSVAGYLVSNDKRALVGLLGSIVPFWKSVFTPVVRLFSMEPAEAANKSFSERIDFLQQFSEEFERVVGSLPKNHYLAIFVDDLDRCPPNRVANVLEALNRLMESRLCFVVLGMDPDTVRRCVEMRYEKLIASLAKDGSERATNFGEQFLEKLVGLAVSVPPVPPDELEAKQVEEQQAREAAVPRGQQLRELLKDFGTGVLSRIDQVLVTAVLIAAVATVFLCWRQDPQRVEGWVRTVVTLDQERAAGPTPVGSAATARKEGQEGLPHVEAQPVAKPEPDRATKTAALPAASAKTPSASVSTPPALRVPPPGAVDVRRVVGKQPEFPKPTEVARVTQPHAEPLSREYETAANFNRVLMLGVGVVTALGALLLGAMLWREIQIDRRAPPRKDSEAFARGLKTASARFKNPRQRVRYRNLARLTYHLVAAEAPKGQMSWEGTFFELLSAHVLGGELTPHPEHAWVATELDRWLERVARAAGQPAALRANSSIPPKDTSGTQRSANRQYSSAPPTGAVRDSGDDDANVGDLDRSG